MASERYSTGHGNRHGAADHFGCVGEPFGSSRACDELLAGGCGDDGHGVGVQKTQVPPDSMMLRSRRVSMRRAVPVMQAAIGGKPYRRCLSGRSPCW